MKLVIFFSLLSGIVSAQEPTIGELHGNFQSDIQYYIKDTLIAAANVPEKIASNSFLNLIYTNGSFSAGVRYEAYLPPLAGFDPGYKNPGYGIPYRYASYTSNDLEVTVGNFYEQYGSGMILRAYEEKNLGIDNAFDGVRLRYTPVKGLYLKGLLGKQRIFWSTGAGLVRGLDAEASINDLLGNTEISTQIIAGASVVSKYQAAQNATFIFPENVAAFGGRMTVINGDVTVGGEYVYKINDPSSANSYTYKDTAGHPVTNYVYKNGQGLLINASYSTKGFGFSLGVKRLDNMSFRSDRFATGNNLTINFLPSLTKQHAYTLAAFYPDATIPNGEVGAQAELTYKFSRETGVTVNYSRANGLDTTRLPDSTHLGYTAPFFSFGKELYYQDFNIELSHKFSSATKLTLTYLNIISNEKVLRVADTSLVHANIGIIEVEHELSTHNTIRGELQAMVVPQTESKGSWVMGLLEYSIAPHWFFALSDLYNYGNAQTDQRFHYASFSTGYSTQLNRFALTYGRQRAGVVCVGGVCRTVPATNGVSLSITSNF